jgi:hypothetical protein
VVYLVSYETKNTTCDLGLILYPLFIKDLDSVVDEFRGRRELMSMTLGIEPPKQTSPEVFYPSFCPSSAGFLVSQLRHLYQHVQSGAIPRAIFLTFSRIVGS